MMTPRINRASRTHSSPWVKAFFVAALALAAGQSAAVSAQSQWVTNGDNISNTNPGNVGVGITSPTAPLDVRGSNAASSFSLQLRSGGIANTTNSTQIAFGWNGTDQYRHAITTSHNSVAPDGNTIDFLLWNQGTDAATARGTRHVMRLSGTGNVGIGTAAPSSQLHLYNPNNVYGTGLVIDSHGALSSQQAKIDFMTSGDGTKGTFQIGSKGWHLTARGNAYSVAAEQNDLGLFFWNGSSYFTSTYWDSASGYVGIGTAGPQAKLHLVGGAGRFANTDNASTVQMHNTTTNKGYSFYGAGDDLRLWEYASGFGPGGGDRLTIQAGGNIGVGTSAPAARLHVAGDIQVDGNIAARYQDVAEWVPSTQKLTPGMVVVLDTSRVNHVVASGESYDTTVAGVVSEQPGIILGEAGEGKVKVATTGRVKVRVDATRAPVRIGDLLVTSDVPGVAMKSEPIAVGGRKMHAPGTLIGKALEPLEKGTGEILVLLSLQ